MVITRLFNPWFNPNGALWKMAVSLPYLSRYGAAVASLGRARAGFEHGFYQGQFVSRHMEREVRC